MTVAQQTVTRCSLGIVGVLIVASVVGYVLDRRFATAGPNPTIDNLNAASRRGG